MARHERGSKSGTVMPAQYEELSRRGYRGLERRRRNGTSFSAFRTNEARSTTPVVPIFFRGHDATVTTAKRSSWTGRLASRCEPTATRGHCNYGENEGTKATFVLCDVPEQFVLATKRGKTSWRRSSSSVILPLSSLGIVRSSSRARSFAYVT